MKYKYLTFALLPILALTLTACTLKDLPLIGQYFGGGKSAGPVTLKMWGLWESPEVMKVLVAKYKEKNPNVTIDYDDNSVLNLNEYKQSIYTRAQNKDLPDIVAAHAGWVPSLSQWLAPAPASLMSTDTFSKTFYPIASDLGVLSGKIYAMPTYYDGLALVYNKNHFAEINQASAPVAWEEFRRLAKQLTIKNGQGIVRAGAAMGSSKNIDMFPDILGMLFQQAFQGTDTDEKFPDALDSQEAQDVLTFYTNFVKEDQVWSESFPDAATAFADGKVSMIFVPSWKLLDILNAKDRFNFEIGVAPVPQAIPDKPVTWGSYWVNVVPASGKNTAQAWDFLNFLASEQQQLTSFSETSKFRLFGAPYSMKGLATQLDSNPNLKPYVESAQFAKGGLFSGRAGNRKQVDALAKAVQAVVSGQPANNALSTAKSEMSQ